MGWYYTQQTFSEICTQLNKIFYLKQEDCNIYIFQCALGFQFHILRPPMRDSYLWLLFLLISLHSLIVCIISANNFFYSVSFTFSFISHLSLSFTFSLYSPNFLSSSPSPLLRQHHGVMLTAPLGARQGLSISFCRSSFMPTKSRFGGAHSSPGILKTLTLFLIRKASFR